MPAWNPELATGVSDIDDQHQELFRRAEAADAALCDGHFGPETVELLQFLSGYCARHFANEARLMNERRYGDAAGHLAQHAWFTKTMRAIERDLASGAPRADVAMRLNELVLSWLVKHIASTDKALGAFLRGSGGAR